jgi:hypothetical protein
MLKYKYIILTVMMLVCLIAATPAKAITVDLDGIANAGWSAGDLNKTYLNIYNLDSMSYSYQWQYGNGALPWLNLNALVSDLNDGTLNNDGSNASIGNWHLESGGDVFSAPQDPIWKSISLTKGVYDLSLASTSGAYNLVDYWGGNSWNAYVQIWADYGDSLSFGNGLLSFGSKADALGYYHTNVDGLQLYLAQNANVYFYINDYNSVDNSGGIKLDIQARVNPVPEPATMVLMGSGLVAMGFRIRRLKRKA